MSDSCGLLTVKNIVISIFAVFIITVIGVIMCFYGSKSSVPYIDTAVRRMWRMIFAAEKDLVLEIDRLRHHGKNGKWPKSQSGAVGTFIKDLEDERDYWKSQVGDLQQLLRSRSGVSDLIASQTSMTTRSRSHSHSPARRTTSTSTITSPTRRNTVSRATSPVSPAKKVCLYIKAESFYCRLLLIIFAIITASERQSER